MMIFICLEGQNVSRGNGKWGLGGGDKMVDID